MTDTEFESSAYWQNRYETGSTSGAGSYGSLALYKARILNEFVKLNDARSAIDFGCGDGNQLGYFDVESYIGLDISEAALARCRKRTDGRSNYSFRNMSDLHELERADIGVSMDVIYHLTEDQVFERYILNLFTFSRRFCIIYASNGGSRWTAKHVRHRTFTDFISQQLPEWRLAACIPNAYPFRDDDPDNTSFADFYIYAAKGESCLLSSPGPQ